MDIVLEKSGAARSTHDDVERSIKGLGSTREIPSIKFALEPLRAIQIDKSRQWLISKLMPSRGLHVLYGAPGAGKSFVALNAALHVAAGRSWAGHDVREAAGVVYVAAEGGRSFRKRVVAAKDALRVPDSTPFALITQAPQIGGLKDETAKLIDDIRKQCERLRFSPRLIVLDTLSRSITGLRESDAGDIMQFVDLAQTMAEKFDALVMPIHHCGKDEGRGMRGSSALHAAADAEWYVRKDADTGDRHLVVEKMKDGAGNAQLRYTLKNVELDTDETGEMITTCVVEVRNEGGQDSEATRDLLEVQPTQAMRTFLGLKMLVECVGHAPPAPSSAPSDARVIAIKRAKNALMASGLLPSDPPKNADVALRRALKTLVEKKLVEHDDEFVWCVDTKTKTAESKPKPV